jgi:hypothetical protein
MIAPRFMVISRVVRSAQAISSIAMLLGLSALGLDLVLQRTGLA